ncbi:similar to Saccharomyces cerevisiae YBL018C POP8 Subunit of both RNase MRP and nuclear RNase P [Maudiozyma barnettii]|uniref:Similar to Saccharomyces cerevisiae YBL018C POP8 Subunit of both RNase MRP and nuclear RNase P n=1 Tax=Maudiozyma barnettii TaxID=61262 RepID=A0A8H2VBW5_9SACH|nr:ribonuclease P [Kazachstania barnettii]CAB4252408.1 similar to Saccharomyces cerevisiae YBL018C POP8 Subunit of both RNase MRP and nuclear RNase P [Kazachstania barnettii]CAD1779143.1 similar to Saccharomyces cerevisiae YBL018C POP8 Subunit of both RNase MRP and nuclear RNase P [Kazachstania barnettii]
MSKCIKVKEWTYFKLSITTLDKETDDENVFDEMTWRQWLKNALKRSHGIFGEGIEYYIVRHDGNILYIKVFFKDKDILSQAIATYISSEELVGRPLIVSIVLEANNIDDLSNNADDILWLTRLKEDTQNDSECAPV